MKNTPEECYELIENMTTHTSASRDETSRNISSTSTTESPEVVRQLEMMNKNFLEMIRQIQTIKAVDTKCETYGGPHSVIECPAVSRYTQETAYATTDLKAITTQSGVTLARPSVSLPSKEVDQEPETITDQVLTESTNNVPPLVIQSSPISTSCFTISSSKMPQVTKDRVQPKEIEACLRSKSIPLRIDDTDLDLEGDIRLLEELLNNDPSLSPLPPKELNDEEIKTIKSSIDEPPELELKELSSHLEYAFLERTDKLPMLERLAENEFYCFLDGFSRYFQIPIDPQDQEKTTFTCPYEMFAYRRMPFGLCTPGTFQMCMMAIFHNMIKKTMECHFMVKEGIVLGHKISKSGIKVNRAKVDVIAKLPHPTSVRGAENLAADHLSRLENPHQDELEKKEIIETFLLKTLGMIAFRGDSSTPWFTDFSNYHAGNFIVKGMSS
nr:DNA-directed DNA polymerase [Tanacetum cinerariifolium]